MNLCKRAMCEEDFDPATEDLVHKLRVMSIYPSRDHDSLIEGIRCLAVSSSKHRDPDAAPVGCRKPKRYVLADQIQMKSSSLFTRKLYIEELARRSQAKR